MTSPNGPEGRNGDRPDNIYSLRRGKPSVVICGWSHADYNLHGAYTVVNDFVERLNTLEPGAPVTFYLESFGLSQGRDRRSVYRLIDEYGLPSMEVYDAILRVSGKSPERHKFVEKLHMLHGLNDEEVIRKSLTDQSMKLRPSSYILSRRLEEIAAQRPFAVDFETHPRGKIARISRQFADSEEMSDRAIEQALKGDLDGAILLLKKSNYRLSRGIMTGREAGMIDKIKTLARRNNVQSPDPGLVYCLLGSAHLEMGETLRRKLGSAVHVEQVITNVHPMIPDVWQAARTPQDTSDESYARYIMLLLVSENVEKELLTKQDVFDFAYFYETIEHVLGSAIGGMNYEQIKTILGRFADSGITEEVVATIRSAIRTHKRQNGA